MISKIACCRCVCISERAQDSFGLICVFSCVVFEAAFNNCSITSQHFLDKLQVLLVHSSWHQWVSCNANPAIMSTMVGEAITPQKKSHFMWQMPVNNWSGLPSGQDGNTFFGEHKKCMFWAIYSFPTIWLVVETSMLSALCQPFPSYNKSAADDF